MGSAATRSADLALGAVGIVLFLGLWQLAGTLGWGGLTLPALSDVLATLLSPQRQGIFVRAVTATLYALARGYLIGVLLGIVIAAVTRLVPPLQEGLDGFAALLHAIPAIALAPVFMLFFLPEDVPVAIAAISVFFILYVTTRSALAAATSAHHDVFTALGASRWKRYAHLELPAAVPQIASALKLAVPVGLVGIVVGEWFGAPRGLGLLMVSAMQNFQIPQLWSAVLLASLSSLILYGVFSLIERAAHERYR